MLSDQGRGSVGPPHPFIIFFYICFENCSNATNLNLHKRIKRKATTITIFFSKSKKIMEQPMLNGPHCSKTTKSMPKRTN